MWDTQSAGCVPQFAPEAVEQLEQIEEYIAEQGSSRVATAYVDVIVAFCESLQSFPNRGTQRDDIRPGLRITNYKGSAIIAFAVISGECSAARERTSWRR